MQDKNELSRMTIDIPQKDHRQLKALSAVLGKSMRQMVIESIEDYLHSVKIPNKKTLKAMQDVENGGDLVETESAQDLFKKLGI